MIKETKDYVLEVVMDTDDNGVERSIYGVVNKNTGVVEASISVLPQALMWLEQIQETLDELEKGQTPKLNVLNFSKH